MHTTPNCFVRFFFQVMIFVPTIENREELCIRMVYFFLFSRQNQALQIVIGLGLGIYHTEILKVVIRTTLKNFEIVFPVSRKTDLKLMIFHFSSSE